VPHQPYQLTNYEHYRTAPSGASRWRTAGLVAAALGAAALYVNAKARQAEAENPPKGKFIDVDGVRLHYVDRGVGEPVVLLHGNGITASDFEASGLLPRAAQQYRVIAFDRPGFGYSERPRSTIWTPEAQADLIAKALKQLGIEQPVVVGHSWGTLVALALGLNHQAEVRGLVLISGYYYASPRLDVALLAQPGIPVIGDLLRHTISPLLSRALWPLLVKHIFSPAPVPDSFKQLPVWMMLRPSQLRASGAESALMIPSVLKLYKRYSELTIPVQLLAGADDALINPGHNSARLVNDLPDSTVHTRPGQGHMVHYAHVDDIMQAIATVRTTPIRGIGKIDNAAASAHS
jgi:pimeloyl-ACP methyl ester carboxylesterase